MFVKRDNHGDVAFVLRVLLSVGTNSTGNLFGGLDWRQGDGLKAAPADVCCSTIVGITIPIRYFQLVSLRFIYSAVVGLTF